MADSIGPGVESVAIELYGADPSAARWDTAVWDGARWGGAGWLAVACEVAEANYTYGATDEAGILSVPASGPADFATYDPDRLLDPSNADGPFFGSIGPGAPFRLTGLTPATHPAWTGFIDEVSYDIASGTGRIRCVDGIAYAAQANILDGVVLPDTLRARVRAIVAATSLGPVLPVEADSADSPADWPVAPHDGKSKAAWQAMQDAAQDALVLLWLGPDGVLHFRSWGSFPDAPMSIGCPPAGDTGLWVEGLRTISTRTAAAAIRNTVRAWSAVNVTAPAKVDGPSVQRYGQRLLDVQRVVPNRDVWAQRILDDRAGSGLGISLGEVRPYSATELDAMLTMRGQGPSTVRVYDDDHPPTTDLDVGIIGGNVRVTPSGWSFAYVCMIPRTEWAGVTPEPPDPPIPPPDAWHTETRTYTATSDALVALTSGGSNYGAGAASSLPVGVWSGWTYRSLIQFPAIPWTKIRGITSATLKLRTSTQDRVGFGSSPTIELRRITGSWSAGSASSPSSGNAVVYPGPATTTSGAVRSNVTKSQSTDVNIRVDAIVKAWAPGSVGGSAAAQRGIALYGGSGSTADTTEFLPVESPNDPVLTLVVQVFD
jgi:hypothetical protein